MGQKRREISTLQLWLMITLTVTLPPQEWGKGQTQMLQAGLPGYFCGGGMDGSGSASDKGLE
ncbi:hypothetical protein M758_5G134500 [Ceratodon purpureus]|uniref:Uncharacterized protein n=1 Tax=Ceratodon purpureus TaxID=3225 RepID=A0A8T0I1A1_CERPU|nr:hypothetical protein KC19_5G140700 [Ceratodon purpureus]KAG0616688.1 hypothetical protein M758_5G134500 [Ceratodon purpureus]